MNQQPMMRNKKDKPKSRTIPVRFLDEEAEDRDHEETREAAGSPDEGRSGEPSAEDIGRESSYEDETEVQRRIDRGAEADTEAGRERADERDVAGGPPRDEMPERREDTDQATRGAGASAHESAAHATDGHRDGQAPRDMTAEKQLTGPIMAELLATRAELKRVEAERAELQTNLVRRQADFDNFRKRVERERGEAYNRLVGQVAGRLLPVLDNLRRALDAEAVMQAQESEEFRHFLNGVELIYKQLNGVLDSLGVKPVAAVGERFDPHVHEAVVTEQTDDYEPDTVMQELVRGYRLGDILLRPAAVKVATR